MTMSTNEIKLAPDTPMIEIIESIENQAKVARQKNYSNIDPREELFNIDIMSSYLVKRLKEMH